MKLDLKVTILSYPKDYIYLYRPNIENGFIQRRSYFDTKGKRYPIDEIREAAHEKSEDKG